MKLHYIRKNRNSMSTDSNKLDLFSQTQLRKARGHGIQRQLPRVEPLQPREGSRRVALQS